MFKDYNMNQVILPLDLEMKLQKNDIAYTIHDLVEQIQIKLFLFSYMKQVVLLIIHE